MEIVVLIVVFFALDLIAVGLILYVKSRKKEEIDPEEAIDIYLEFDRKHSNHPILKRALDHRLDEPVTALRSLGFFASFEHLDDQELARQIFRQISLEFVNDNPFTTMADRPTNWRSIVRAYQQSPGSISGPELDLLVAGEDTYRIWWEDLDQIRRGNDGYVRTLRRWAEISRGAFQPTDIAESWGSDEESVLVTFELAGTEHAFIHLTGYDDHIDTASLRNFINPLIADSGIQFEIVEIRDTPNIVVALREEERRQLTDERGWTFTEAPSLIN